jgi:hypothetical protein
VATVATVVQEVVAEMQRWEQTAMVVLQATVELAAMVVLVLQD